MLRLQAIVLVIALFLAPAALFAGVWECACAPAYCTMSCCRHGKCMAMEHGRCQRSGTAVRCNCMRFPTLATLAPLTEMVLTAPAVLPTIEPAPAAEPPVAVVVLPGFLPTPFHPPRG
jgi:hypothetical protein